MANLSTKIKMYAAANGVTEVDFMKDVMLQDDSDGKGAYIKEWNLIPLHLKLLNLKYYNCLLYTSPSPRDGLLSRMPSSA